MSTIELSRDTERVLAMKRQAEELVDNITEYIEEKQIDADAVNDRLISSLSEINDALDNALLMSINEEFVKSNFKRI